MSKPTRQDRRSIPTTVQEDWTARLSKEKQEIFESIVHRWEGGYSMLSIALDDAMTLRDQGELGRANQELEVASAMVDYLAPPLLGAYRAFEKYAHQMNSLPVVSALSPSFYRGVSSQQCAAWNQLLHRILFGSRARFLHKLRALEGLVLTLAEEFRETAEELSLRVRTRPMDSWRTLDVLHYDLNTSLRETTVLLKSFLRALPESRVEAFREELETSVSSVRRPVRQRLSRASA